MNKTENQLASLSEECHEAGQVACKAMRFGLENIPPDKNETNRRILEREIADILGVAEELGLVIRPEDIAAKRKKLEKYRTLSIELGTLEVRESKLEQLELQNQAMRNRLKQIAESEDTTRLTGEQILMGYNVHKDLARAALGEMQNLQKRDTCENYRKISGEVAGRYCSVFEAGFPAHAPTCQFFRKPINEQCWCAAKAEAKDAVCPIHG
jgi:hypothetical protein